MRSIQRGLAVAVVSALAVLAILARSLPVVRRATGTPNIIFVMADDLHYDDLGSYGGKAIQTPNLDRLAKQGARFTDYHSSGSICTPTRAAVLTGLYPHRLNLQLLIRHTGYPDARRKDGKETAGSKRGIPAEVMTLGDVLHTRGYVTAHFGKWHVGRRTLEFAPLQEGFDQSIVAASSRRSLHWDNNLFVGDRVSNAFEGRGDQLLRAEGHLIDTLTRQAVEFIRARADEPQPFFLNVWHMAPHEPIDPHPRWAERYPETELGRYAAMVSHIDESMGTIATALEDLDLDRDTLLVFASDNGGTEKSHPDSQLRGGKAELFEGGIRVPLVASWPGTIPAGTVRDDVLTSMDLLPTFAELAGADLATLHIDGRSFAATLRNGPAGGERVLFWEGGGPGTAIGDFAVRRGKWKLLSETGERFLFDLDADPAETTDLTAAHGAIANELAEAYADWRLDERLVDYRLESPAAGDPAEKLDVEFGAEGGTVALHPSSLYDLHDGHFSLGLWVRLAPEMPPRPTTIARNPGRWSLELTADRKPRLRVQGDGGAALDLLGEGNLAGEGWHHLAVAIEGNSIRDSQVALYLDGALQTSDESLKALAPDVGPEGRTVIFGTPAQSGDHAADLPGPLVGTLRGLRIYLMGLRQDEVAELVRRGPAANPLP